MSKEFIGTIAPSGDQELGDYEEITINKVGTDSFEMVQTNQKDGLSDDRILLSPEQMNALKLILNTNIE